MRFLIYENYEDPWKIELFFDDVITGQDEVITRVILAPNDVLTRVILVVDEK